MDEEVSVLSGSTWHTKVTHLEQMMEERTVALTTEMAQQNQKVQGQFNQIHSLLQALVGRHTNLQGKTGGTGPAPPLQTELNPRGRHLDRQDKTEATAEAASHAEGKGDAASAEGS